MGSLIIGLDIAKHVFEAHGIDDAGQVVFRRRLKRAEVLSFFAEQPASLVGIEACGTAHHWAREISELGHEVRLMPPAYVKPYLKRGKSDVADAEAIAEAVARHTMRFVAVKSTEQQAELLSIVTELKARGIAASRRRSTPRRPPASSSSTCSEPLRISSAV